MVDWADIEASYAELQKARTEGGSAILMRLSEMQLCLGDALDAQVSECVTVNAWSWQRIADALGVTRQAASKRWGRKVFR